MSKLAWIKGPAHQPVTGRATIDVPAHMLYLDSSGTRRFLELTGNLPGDDLYTIAAPDLSWFAIFGFENSGYVKDDEKIDPDALLKTLRDNQEAGNEERKKQGLDALTLEGWSAPPHYDRTTHNLEWGMKLLSSDGENVNYTTRLLGRHGVMSATLVTDPREADKNMAAFRVALAGFHYVPDERYEAYKDGDKVAEYGLAALITGGAAAAAVKAGAAKGILALLAAFGKYILIGFAAAAAAFRRFFGRLFGRGDPAE
ncbi:DUF2167 domain-containing protein [Flavisphingomonas formosensis]|uniref:DUF2167 domain-containing protein n=1 Tax=Flavisphingomonas formosensis TaxID=861534 RepID=UPI0012FBB9AF|nr:DUF2167 domain-containing protein [Sphingomonas formosensis]